MHRYHHSRSYVMYMYVHTLTVCIASLGSGDYDFIRHLLCGHEKRICSTQTTMLHVKHIFTHYYVYT